jgi:5-aminolevulinate synthase
VPVPVGDARTCKAVSDYLLNDLGIYIQPINYPTVPRGTERLRITPTPLPTDEHIDKLVAALSGAWRKFGLWTYLKLGLWLAMVLGPQSVIRSS